MNDKPETTAHITRESIRNSQWEEARQAIALLKTYRHHIPDEHKDLFLRHIESVTRYLCVE